MIATTDKHFDVVGFLMDYESGSLCDEQIVEGFQHLINDGLVWKLQGTYGRMAKALIEAGYCHPPTRKERS
jgi:hypothetical protein